MAEWLKAHAWKACKRATVSQVRILFSPPIETSQAEPGMFLLNLSLPGAGTTYTDTQHIEHPLTDMEVANSCTYASCSLPSKYSLSFSSGVK